MGDVYLSDRIQRHAAVFRAPRLAIMSLVVLLLLLTASLQQPNAQATTQATSGIGLLHHHAGGVDGPDCPPPVAFGIGTTRFDVAHGQYCSISSITVQPGSPQAKIQLFRDQDGTVLLGQILSGSQPGTVNVDQNDYYDGVIVTDESQSYRFLQFNMFGGVGHEGRLEIANKTAKSILDFGPVIVTLNEVCEGQAKRVQERVNEKSAFPDQMEMQFFGSRPAPEQLKDPDKQYCPLELVQEGEMLPGFRPQKIGNAILFRGTLQAREEYSPCPDSGTPGNCIRNIRDRSGKLNETRMLCVRVTLNGDEPRAVRACVTHLQAINHAPPLEGQPQECPPEGQREPNRKVAILKHQIQDVASILTPEAKSVPTVVGGDFNTHIGNKVEWCWLKPMLEEFRDVDANMTPTWSARNPPPSLKLDYIFLSHQFENLSARVSYPAKCGLKRCSDHLLLKGSATLAPGTGGNYILAGGPGADVGVSVDDDLQIYLNGALVFADNDGHATSLPPITFRAAPGDAVRIVAIDTVGVCRGLSPDLSLIAASDGSARSLGGFPAVCGTAAGETFYDKTFII